MPSRCLTMRDATQALTVLAELDPGPIPRAWLDHRLAEIDAHPDDNPFFQPGSLPDTHFMRFAIIDDPRGELPSLLAWETNHDGRAADYLAAVARAAPAIHRIFECCADYPATGLDDLEAWIAWMLERAEPAGAFYIAYRGVPRSKILNDRLVHDALRKVVDHADRTQLCGLSRCEIQRRLC